MFNWFRKPKAVIVISRLTGQQEQCSITVNSFSLDQKELYNIVTNAARALQQRLVDNNMAALQGLEEKAVKVTELSQKKKEVE